MKPQDTTYWEKRDGKDTHPDWSYKTDDWITGYEQSIDHPHRKPILDILKDIPFKSLLEIGCSVGPNLKLIDSVYPKAELYGIDPNEDSVKRAKTYTIAQVGLGDVRNLRGEWDVILACASLMYITPEEIEDVMNRIALSANRSVIIIDRCCDSKLGKVCGFVWGRDYALLLKERGFKVTSRKITEKDWPGSPNWAKYGQYVVGIK